MPMVKWAEMDVLYVAAIYVYINASINTHCNGYRLGIWLCFVSAIRYGKEIDLFSTLNGDVTLSDKIVMVRIIKSVRKVLINGHCISMHAQCTHRGDHTNMPAYTFTACNGLKDLLIFDAALVGLAYEMRLWWCGHPIDFMPQEYLPFARNNSNVAFHSRCNLPTLERGSIRIYEHIWIIDLFAANRLRTRKRKSVIERVCAMGIQSLDNVCNDDDTKWNAYVVSLLEAKEVVEPATAFKFC